MEIRVAAGTPNEMTDRNTYKTPADAKKFLKGRIKTQREFARRYNLDLNARLGVLAQEIDGCDPRLWRTGEIRQWEATDDHTGVIFRFTMEVVSK